MTSFNVGQDRTGQFQADWRKELDWTKQDPSRNCFQEVKNKDLLVTWTDFSVYSIASSILFCCQYINPMLVYACPILRFLSDELSSSVNLTDSRNISSAWDGNHEDTRSHHGQQNNKYRRTTGHSRTCFKTKVTLRLPIWSRVWWPVSNVPQKANCCFATLLKQA